MLPQNSTIIELPSNNQTVVVHDNVSAEDAIPLATAKLFERFNDTKYANTSWEQAIITPTSASFSPAPGAPSQLDNPLSIPSSYESGNQFGAAGQPNSPLDDALVPTNWFPSSQRVLFQTPSLLLLAGCLEAAVTGRPPSGTVTFFAFLTTLLTRPRHTGAALTDDLGGYQKKKRVALGEFRINTYTQNSQSFPAVGGLTDGGFVVTWQSAWQDGGNWGVYLQHYDSFGVIQGNETRANNYTLGDQGRQSIAKLPEGRYIVMWSSVSQDEDSYYGIYGRLYNTSNMPESGEFLVNTHTDNIQHLPSVDSFPDGSFVAAWRSEFQDGSGYGIFGQRYNATVQPQDGEFRINNYTAGNQYDPDLTGLSDGGFVVVWISSLQDGDGWGVYGQCYDSTNVRQEDEFRVNTNTTSDQIGPSVAGLPTGGFVVSWQSNLQDLSGYGIYAKCYNASRMPQSDEFRVNTNTLNNQTMPSAGSLSDGGFVLVWQSDLQDGDGWGVYAQRYDGNCVPQGNEFRANTYTTGDQSEPSAAGLTGGGFVVTWQSYLQDSDAEGVYGQIFKQLLLASSTLTLIEGQELVLNSAMLNAEDFFVSDAWLTFTVSNIQHGQFDFTSSPYVPITNFTQQQVLDGQVRFIHDGNKIAPSFYVAVSNGPYFTTPIPATIIFTPLTDTSSAVTFLSSALSYITSGSTSPTTEQDRTSMPETNGPNWVVYGAVGGGILACLVISGVVAAVCFMGGGTVTTLWCKKNPEDSDEEGELDSVELAQKKTPPPVSSNPSSFFSNSSDDPNGQYANADRVGLHNSNYANANLVDPDSTNSGSTEYGKLNSLRVKQDFGDDEEEKNYQNLPTEKGSSDEEAPGGAYQNLNL